VRRSFIVYRSRELVYYDQYWAKYPVPLTYLWSRNIKPKTAICSLHYIKNNVINYFKYEIETTSSYTVIPLYNHLKRNYTVMVIDYPHMYMSISGHNIIIDDVSINIVKTPNGNFYFTGIAYNYKGLERCFIVLNAQNGRLLYISDDLEKDDNRITYQYSVPIANSFVIVAKTKKHKINVKVINLINEDVDEFNYDMRNNLEDYEIYRSTFFLGEGIIEIDKSNNGVIFYKRCKFSIYVDKKDKANILSFWVFYENNKIVISLESELNATNMLMKKEYYIESRYDVSESYLYAVFFSVDNHTLMKIQTTWLGKAVMWYYRNSLRFINNYRSAHDLPMENHGDYLLVKDKSKLMILINKQEISKIIKKNYLILSLTRESVEVFKIKDVINLIQNNKENEIFIEISQAIRKINLTEIVINSVTTYLGTDYHVEIDKTLVQLYSSDQTLYFVVFAYCQEQVSYKVLLFVSSINDLLLKRKPLKLIVAFDVAKNDLYYNSLEFRKIVNKIYTISKNAHLSNKIKNIFHTSGSVDIIYNNLEIINRDIDKIYQDVLYNRGSEITASEIGNVICNLNIVKPIIPITSQLQK